MKSVISLAFASVLALAVAGLDSSATAADDDTAAVGVGAGPEQAAAETGPGAPGSGETVRLPREIIEAASAYETFVGQAAAINAAFADGEAINAAMVTAESYQPDQMSQGVAAYASLVALQDGRFVEGVRQAARSPANAETLVRALEADPRQIAAVDGADEAATRVNAALSDQAERLFATGAKVKQSAYDIQHQAWSRQTVPDGSARLARAKALSSTPYAPSADDVARLFQVAAALHDQGHDQGEAPRYAGAGYTSVVQRGLALAALAVLGRADRQELAASGLMSVPDSAGCMQMAKLNLYQCLAVAGPHYEDVFCLGEHALKETGQCLREASAAPAARPAAMASALPGSLDGDAYAVPVAYAAEGRR